jgi:hypothetical protein
LWVGNRHEQQQQQQQQEKWEKTVLHFTGNTCIFITYHLESDPAACNKTPPAEQQQNRGLGTLFDVACHSLRIA